MICIRSMEPSGTNNPFSAFGFRKIETRAPASTPNSLCLASKRDRSDSHGGQTAEAVHFKDEHLPLKGNQRSVSFLQGSVSCSSTPRGPHSSASPKSPPPMPTGHPLAPGTAAVPTQTPPAAAHKRRTRSRTADAVPTQTPPAADRKRRRPRSRTADAVPTATLQKPDGCTEGLPETPLRNPTTEIGCAGQVDNAADRRSLADGPSFLAGDSKALADDPGSLAGDSKALADDPGSLAGDSKALVDDPGSLAGDSKAIVDDPGSLVGDPRKGKKARARPIKSRTAEDREEMLGSAPGVPERLGDAPLRLIIVGANPSDAAWQTGHYYAHPANWFWRILKESGIAPQHIRGAVDDHLMGTAVWAWWMSDAVTRGPTCRSSPLTISENGLLSFTPACGTTQYGQRLRGVAVRSAPPRP
eukprot:jgi/Botrbrau1/8756/Bobra.0090s0029.3